MIKEWKELSRELVFDNWRKIERVVFEFPNKKKGVYYLKNDCSAVAVLALTKEKEVIIAKQFRPGPGKILMELPGGAIEKNLSPVETAKKELLEETGYSGKFEFVTSYCTEGYSNFIGNAFVALDCEKISDQKLDETEFIEVVLLSLEEFKILLRSGKMSDLQVGYLGLDYLGLL